MEMYENKLLHIDNHDTYITEDNRCAYRVKRGNVIVFIIPQRGDTYQRRIFIYEAKEGETIPGFCTTDADYTKWVFGFKCIDSADVQVVKDGSTKVLKRKFAEKIGLQHFNEEGFEKALIEHYQAKFVEEDSVIHKTKKEKKQVAKKAVKLIYNVFEKDAFHVSDHANPSHIYEAMKKLCESYHIQIASFERIRECCGDEISPQNIARVSHFCYREVVLEENWFQKDLGPILAFDKDDNPIACIPKGRTRYLAFDVATGNSYLLNERNTEDFKIKGVMLYKSFPNKQMSIRDLCSFCWENINMADVASLIVFTIIGTLIGILLPILNQKLFDTFIPLSDETLILSIGCVIASFMIGNVFFSIVDNLATYRTSSRLGYMAQSAAYDRLFNLPESFFRAYDSADLAQRAMGIGGIVNQVSSTVLTTILSGVCSAFYLIKMFDVSAKLTAICILMILVYSVVVFFISNKALKHQREINDIDGHASSVIYQFLKGIDKIRIAGVENRALYEFYKPFSKKKELEANSRYVDLFGDTLSLVAESIFAMILYFLIIHNKIEISVGAFVALNSSFGYFSSGILQIVEGAITINTVKPLYERFKPILENVSELDDAKDLPGEIKGDIELSHITFSYDKDSSVVIDDLSLRIKAGEYIGIVGSSGCGKSTLLKLLLGFESPNVGRIYYDGKDLESVDKRELRKKLGVVLQDGDLISGSIFENITITAPKATVTDVNKVVEAVGLKEDIDQMPMGLHTVVSEGCGTISGGQQQRILIARAIINQPNIIYFDEATSALDNITQAKVCESLEQLQSTRIVIAHRLSTIMNCDRILVMDKGRIVEEGSFEELMAKKGLFYRLAERQM